MKCLKISRKRMFRTYLDKLTRYGLLQGFPSCELNSLRWKRLQLCINSVKEYLVVGLKLRCIEV